MQSALPATTERSPIMLPDPSNPLGAQILATAYPGGALRLTLEG